MKQDGSFKKQRMLSIFKFLSIIYYIMFPGMQFNASAIVVVTIICS